MAKTSWMTSNVGRRFMSCDRCRYFRWLDGPLCGRARIIIPGLLRRNTHLERVQKQVECRSGFCSGENEEYSLGGLKGIEKKNSSSNLPLTLLIITWIAILVYWVCKTGDVEEM